MDPPLCILCHFSSGDHLIPHLLTGTIHHHQVSETRHLKIGKTSLRPANVCNAPLREKRWDGGERQMTGIWSYFLAESQVFAL